VGPAHPAAPPERRTRRAPRVEPARRWPSWPRPALANATTAAWATPPTGTQNQADQRKALYRSELDATLARHRALGAIATQPATRTDPAAPTRR
jgi:hypothetical protein